MSSFRSDLKFQLTISVLKWYHFYKKTLSFYEFPMKQLVIKILVLLQGFYLEQGQIIDGIQWTSRKWYLFTLQTFESKYNLKMLWTLTKVVDNFNFVSNCNFFLIEIHRNNEKRSSELEYK